MESKRYWRKRTILFFASQCVTLFGSQIVQMAIVWYVTLQTDSGVWVAAFSVCSYLPQFFVSFLGGVWADRYNRKSLIIGADALIAAVSMGMMLLIPYITTDSVLLTALLLMSIIRSAGTGIQNPSVNAVIPQLVPEEHLMRYSCTNYHYNLTAGKYRNPHAGACIWFYERSLFQLLSDRNGFIRSDG